MFGESLVVCIWVASALGIAYQVVFHEKYKMLEIFFYLAIGICPSIVVIDMVGFFWEVLKFLLKFLSFILCLKRSIRRVCLSWLLVEVSLSVGFCSSSRMGLYRLPMRSGICLSALVHVFTTMPFLLTCLTRIRVFFFVLLSSYNISN